MEFSKLLTALASPNNEVRKGAQTELTNAWLHKNKDGFFAHLAENVRGGAGESVRIMACLLLRRYVKDGKRRPEDDAWQCVRPETRECVRSNLVESVKSEKDGRVRAVVADTIGEILPFVTSLGRQRMEWAELDAIVSSMLDAPVPIKQSICSMLAAYPQIALPYLSSLPLFFELVLCNINNDWELISQGFKAFSAVFTTQKSMSQRLVQLLPSFISVCQQKGFDDVACISIFYTWSDFVSSNPDVVPHLFNYLINYTSMYFSSENNDVLRSSIDLALCMSNISPECFVNNPIVLKNLVSVLFEMLCDLQDDSADESEDEDSNHVFASQSLDELSCNVGGQELCNVVMEKAFVSGQSTDWKRKYAALSMLSATAEGLTAELQNSFDMIMSFIFMLSQENQCEQVRYAAVHAIGQLSTDFAPLLQEKYHSIAFGFFINLLSSNLTNRTKIHAAQAVVNFVEGANEIIITPYFSEAVAALIALFSLKDLAVQEQAVGTLSTLFDGSPRLSVGYLETIVPVLFPFASLQPYTASEYNVLRSRSIEALSRICLNAGRANFERYLDQFISIVLTLFEFYNDPKNAEETDFDQSCLSYALISICRLLGKDFIPIFKRIFSQILARAASDRGIVVANNYEDTKQQNDGWEYVAVDDGYIGINTAQLSDKRDAIDSLAEYANILKRDFGPWVEECMKVMVPLINFQINEEIRLSALECIESMFSCAHECIMEGGQKENEKANLIRMWVYVTDLIFVQLEKDINNEFFGNVCETIAGMLSFLGTSFITQELLDRIDLFICKYLDSLQQLSNMELDDEDYETLIEKIGSLVHRLFVCLEISYNVYFDHVRQTLLGLLNRGINSNFSTEIISLFLDYIEFGKCSPDAVVPVLQFISNNLASTDACIMQMCAYSVGIIFKSRPEEFKSWLYPCIPTLFSILGSSVYRSKQYFEGLDNVVSAIAKVCRYPNQEKIDVRILEEIAPSLQGIFEFLENARIRADYAEAVETYTFVSDLYLHYKTANTIPDKKQERKVLILCLRSLLHYLSLEKGHSEDLTARVKDIVCLEMRSITVDERLFISEWISDSGKERVGSILGMT